MSSTVWAPFLYQTKTILQRPRCNSIRSLIRAKCHHQRRQVYSKAKGLSFQDDDSQFIQDKARLVAQQLDWSAKSSMTRSERRAIEKALSLISSQNGQPEQETKTQKRDGANSAVDEILQMFASSVGSSSAEPQDPVSNNPSTSPIPQTDNALDENNDRKADQSQTDSMQLQPENVGLFEQLAQIRREDSERATFEGSTRDHTEQPSKANQGHDTEATINEIVKTQMIEFSQACNSAINSKAVAGDIALWKVIEERIFPLIQVFQFNNTTREAATDEPAPNNDDLNSAQHPEAEKPAAQPIATASLPVVTRLYPASLLFALRLFTKYFPTSPFPSALLPHIRSLGPTSYILGANTHFYNDLISFKWSIYSNLREINNLLSEMERWGVPFDTGTYKALMKISEDRWNDLHPDDGGKGTTRGAMWWERPDHAVWLARVLGWRKLIASRLEEQGFGEVLREGVERDLEENYRIDNGGVGLVEDGEQMKDETVWI